MDDAEFIYYTDKDGCINSGGFCIKSIMLKNTLFFINEFIEIKFWFCSSNKS